MGLAAAPFESLLDRFVAKLIRYIVPVIPVAPSYIVVLDIEPL
jgi:hypothetical protein